MKDLKFDHIIKYLKNNHPKKAMEISDCLEILNEGLESTLESINSDMQTYIKEKNCSKLRELTDISEEISKFQNYLETYVPLLMMKLRKFKMKMMRQSIYLLKSVGHCLIILNIR